MVRPTVTEMTVMKEKSQISRNRKHGTPLSGPTWGSTRTGQEAEGVRGNCGQEPLLWFPWEEMGEAG